MFVSIHANSNPDPYRRGFEVYIARAASFKSSLTAKAILKRMSSGSGLKSNGLQKSDFRVLVKTQGPAVLVEIGYLSNRSEASLISKNSYQSRIAKAISDGICDVIGQL